MTKMKEKCFLDKPLNTIYYECSSHQNTLLNGLNILRENGELLDVSLITDGQTFRAHKAVLSACSDYFRAMFTDNMREKLQNEITLNGVNAEGFRLLLDYAYTSRLTLNLANVQSVLSAASHVQMLAVVQACSDYLQSQIDIENCVDIATIAETYSLIQLKKKVYRYMSGHLLEFSTSNEFYRLTPQQLQNLLAYEFPVDCSEADVLRIVLTWFFHVDNSKLNTRLGFAMKIFRYIHFIEISPKKLNKALDKAFESREYENRLFQIIVHESSHQRNSLEVNVKSNLLNSRGMEMAILKIGGFGVSGITNEITYRLTDNGKWRHLTSIPHVEQCNYGTAVLNNELYIVGGCFNQSLQENLHPFGFKYTPSYNKWTTILPMATERCRFTLNIVDKKLYAIGGACEVEDYEGGHGGTASCECYDPATDSWHNIEWLPECRTQHAGASYEKDFMKFIFISGGMERDTVVSSLLRYDVDLDEWRQCAPMLTPRADHVMLCIGHCLYVCGGWREDYETRTRFLNCTIDVYNIVNDTWETVTQVPTPRYHAGIVNIENTIYFIGGFLHNDAMFDKDTAAIECYNIETDTWTTREKYPQDIWEHTCVALYIPRYREDMEIISSVESDV